MYDTIIVGAVEKRDQFQFEDVWDEFGEICPSPSVDYQTIDGRY